MHTDYEEHGKLDCVALLKAGLSTLVVKAICEAAIEDMHRDGKRVGEIATYRDGFLSRLEARSESKVPELPGNNGDGQE